MREVRRLACLRSAFAFAAACGQLPWVTPLSQACTRLCNHTPCAGERAVPGSWRALLAELVMSLSALFVADQVLTKIWAKILLAHAFCTCRRCPVRFAQFDGMHTHTGKLPGAQRNSTAAFFQTTTKALSVQASGGARTTAATMMPVGVPRVPYRGRGGHWQWVDIWNCLYRERICFLSKGVDDELGNQVRLLLSDALACGNSCRAVSL
jgi:hypothetical protein